MNRRAVRLMVVMATLSVIGIVITQVYWVKKAFDIKERQYNQTVSIALLRVAEHLSTYNKSTLPSSGVVNQVSSGYYIVSVNQMIDANVLEYYLKSEFHQKQIPYDFEYAIYDCATDKMMYGNYICMHHENGTDRTANKSELPKWDKFSFYFGVYFPNKNRDLAADMGIWIFSSFILLVVILFFGYALFIIFEQKRLAEIQTDFINNMTHEFKTPISTIGIAAEVLANPNIVQQPERLANYVHILRTENERLRSQVDKVLQMARVEKQGLQLQKTTINLHELILESTNGIAANAEAEGGKLHYRLQAQHALIEADHLHLTNVLHNLLDNALKYTQQSPQIEISTEEKKGKLILSVKDNGIGIPKEHLSHLFERFFRVPTGNLHDVKGFGLGLNYVQTVVKAHRWTIRVYSEVGQGSTFSIGIPVKSA
jgi:two-component system phosphate regulon sensor histidine kinase PhoR